MKKKILLSIITILLSVVAARSAHFLGGHIEYECLGGSNYLIRYVTYWDCGGVSAPGSITLDATSSCGTLSLNASHIVLDTVSSSTELIVEGGLCSSERQCTECNPNPPPTCSVVRPGVLMKVFEVNATLAACSDWVISENSCCRSTPNGLISNAEGNDFWYIYSTLDNTGGCNSSSTEYSFDPYLCDSLRNDVNLGGSDPDGDSLAYSLIVPYSAPGTPITLNPGYSADSFMITIGSAQLNPQTGFLTVTPYDGQPGVDQTPFVGILIEEFRNGIKVGEVIRDLNFYTVENCSPNDASSLGITGVSNNDQLINDSTMEVCVGDTLSFDITAVDLVNSSNTLSASSNISSSLANAYYTTSGTNPVQTTMTMIGDSADLGTSSFDVIVANNGCPVEITRIFRYYVNTVDCPASTPERRFTGFSLFPNPATKHIRVNLLDGTLQGQLMISDMTGKEILSQSLTSTSSNVAIDLPAGVYAVSVTSAKGRYTKTIVVH